MVYNNRKKTNINCIKNVVPVLLLAIYFALLTARFAFASESAPAKSTDAIPQTRTLVVSADGRGDFLTIQEAVDDANNYDIIRIMPGTYEESIKAAGKIINLVGDDPYSCVIRCPGWDYHNPVLEMSCGTLKNLTLRTYYDGQESSDGTYGYCLHADWDRQIGEDLYCENCHFISESGACAGIGLRPYYTIEFNNCTFDSRNGQGAIFCHDFEVSEAYAGIDMAGQRLVVRNCSLRDTTPSAAVIRLQSQELNEAAAEVTFQRNIVCNESGGLAIGMFRYGDRFINGAHYLGSSDFVLTKVSGQNSDETMNYPG